MTDQLVKRWFGDKFYQLHPLLQQLHIQGGNLSGDVTITYGSGIAGLIGQRLAKKMQLPKAGSHNLSVNIHHSSDGLHWDRSFNNQNQVRSLFVPVGDINNGYWVEHTAPLCMNLTVDINNGGWHWRCLNVSFLGLPIPLWCIPHTNAYKVIDNDNYRFHVEFTLPLIGTLVCYQGLLTAAINR